MLTVGSLHVAEANRRLRGEGLVIRTGPFNFRIKTSTACVMEGVRLLYAHSRVLASDAFADFTVEIAGGRGLRRWFRPQACFEYDGQRIFEPLPQAHGHALLEWAMNWCISSQAHQFLIFHAAVLERGGRALLMPAPPGSGKSTLCAALSLHGWRLLSDELALLDMSTRTFWPLCRPIGLKNQSIDIVRNLAPQGTFSRVAEGTAKGRVAHLRASDSDTGRIDEPAQPAWLVFPQYQDGAPTQLVCRAKHDTVIQVAKNCFNFGAQGQEGFEALVDLVQATDCYDFRYCHLPEAIACFKDLADASAPCEMSSGIANLSRAS